MITGRWGHNWKIFKVYCYRIFLNALLSVEENWTMVTEHDIVQLATQFL